MYLWIYFCHQLAADQPDAYFWVDFKFPTCTATFVAHCQIIWLRFAAKQQLATDNKSTRNVSVCVWNESKLNFLTAMFEELQLRVESWYQLKSNKYSIRVEINCIALRNKANAFPFQLEFNANVQNQKNVCCVWKVFKPRIIMLSRWLDWIDLKMPQFWYVKWLTDCSSV